VSPLTPDQERRRRRIEGLIGLMAPALDLVLAAGDRLARVVAGPHDPEPLATHPPDFPEPSRSAAGPHRRPTP
jgi:hypothetical protein